MPLLSTSSWQGPRQPVTQPISCSVQMFSSTSRSLWTRTWVPFNVLEGWRIIKSLREDVPFDNARICINIHRSRVQSRPPTVDASLCPCFFGHPNSKNASVNSPWMWVPVIAAPLLALMKSFIVEKHSNAMLSIPSMFLLFILNSESFES